MFITAAVTAVVLFLINTATQISQDEYQKKKKKLGHKDHKYNEEDH